MGDRELMDENGAPEPAQVKVVNGGIYPAVLPNPRDVEDDVAVTSKRHDGSRRINIGGREADPEDGLSTHATDGAPRVHPKARVRTPARKPK